MTNLKNLLTLFHAEYLLMPILQFKLLFKYFYIRLEESVFKLTPIEKIFYLIPNIALIAITFDGRLYLIADVWPVFFILINGLLIASSAVGHFATQKGRSRISFFLLSFFLSPILMGLIVAVVTDSRPAQRSID